MAPTLDVVANQLIEAACCALGGDGTAAQAPTDCADCTSEATPDAPPTPTTAARTNPGSGKSKRSFTCSPSVTRNVAAFRHSIPAALWAELKHDGLLRVDAPVP